MTLSGDLFGGVYAEPGTRELLAEGAVVLRGFALAEAQSLIAAVKAVAAAAPFRRMTTPGGFVMSAAITSCGKAGWVTDLSGYRYTAIDPESGWPWPEMPRELRDLGTRAASAAGYDCFVPDACLINCYEPGSRMSLHQDRNERDFSAPIVSVSLGLPITFIFGGNQRSDRTTKVRLEHGDIVVWGGPTRLAFHGVAVLQEGVHSLLGRRRINLTFRKAC